MKILYDYQIFRQQRYGGISRYFTNLIKFSSRQDVVVPVYHPKNYYYNKLVSSFDYKYESMIFESINDAISRFLTRRALRSGEIDIVHPTSTDTYFLKYLKNEKVVVTVHDLVKELYPQFARHQENYVENRRKLLAAADHIIAVSSNTKEDIIGFYGVDPDKITVVHHGLPKKFGRIRINLRGLPERYILYVGQRYANKNFRNFLEAYGEILDEDKSLSLLCVGGGEFTEEERQLIHDYGISRQVKQRNLNDEVLAACYKQAIAFVFPSMYEGFGIPILEAFRMGCPIILSDIESFREVARDAATYIDPKDLESMRKAIRWVLDEDNWAEVQSRVEIGKKYVEEFTLDNTYLNTLKVYNKVLGIEEDVIAISKEEEYDGEFYEL